MVDEEIAFSFQTVCLQVETRKKRKKGSKILSNLVFCENKIQIYEKEKKKKKYDQKWNILIVLLCYTFSSFHLTSYSREKIPSPTGKWNETSSQHLFNVTQCHIVVDAK